MELLLAINIIMELAAGVNYFEHICAWELDPGWRPGRRQRARVPALSPAPTPPG